MKINLITHTFYPAIEAGGPIVSTLNTCKELIKLDSIILVSTSDFKNSAKRVGGLANKQIELFQNINVKYYSEYNFGRFSVSFSQLFYLWNDIKNSDIIHIQGIFNTVSVLGLLYANWLNKKTILSSRGSFGTWCLQSRSFFKRYWLYLFIRPFANKIIWHATSQQEYDDIKYVFPLSNINIIPNGITLDEYKNINLMTKVQYVEKYTNSTIDPNKIIVSMGRIHEVKGFDILIKAFKVIVKNYPNSILLIAGNEGNTKEPTKDKLVNLIQSLNLENYVFFTGQLEGQDKIDFLANADLFCLPSHSENFGNVYAESLAAGTPIVASTNTPWNEVEKYNCGKWVNNTVDETTIAILELLDKDSITLSKNSKKYIKNFTWENIAKKFKKLYEDIG